MSTAWTLHCLDCGKDLWGDELLNDYGLQIVRSVIRSADAFVAFAPVWKQLQSVSAAAELRIARTSGELDPMLFVDHAGHRLVPRNEYGSFDDECGERFTCECCGHQMTCHREKNHDGKHGERRQKAGPAPT